MNESVDTDDFVKKMLAHEPLLNPKDLEQHRARVLDRLGRAERRERLGRRVTLVAMGVGFVLLALLCAAVWWSVTGHMEWPEWAQSVAVLFAALFPLAMLLLGAIYLSRHRRELSQAREAAQRQALLDLQSQVEELKRRISGTPLEPERTRGAAAQGQTKH